MTRQKTLAIRREAQRVDTAQTIVPDALLFRTSVQGVPDLAGRNVPEISDPLVTRSQRFAVGCERQGWAAVGVFLERETFRASCDIPEANSPLVFGDGE